MKSMQRQLKWSLAMLFTTLSQNSVVARWMIRRLMSQLITYLGPLVMRQSRNQAKIKINNLTLSGLISLRRLMGRILLAKILLTSLNTLIISSIKLLGFFLNQIQCRVRNLICCYSLTIDWWNQKKSNESLIKPTLKISQKEATLTLSTCQLTFQPSRQMLMSTQQRRMSYLRDKMSSATI